MFSVLFDKIEKMFCTWIAPPSVASRVFLILVEFWSMHHRLNLLKLNPSTFFFGVRMRWVLSYILVSFFKQSHRWKLLIEGQALYRVLNIFERPETKVSGQDLTVWVDGYQNTPKGLSGGSSYSSLTVDSKDRRQNYHKEHKRAMERWPSKVMLRQIENSIKICNETFF